MLTYHLNPLSNPVKPMMICYLFSSENNAKIYIFCEIRHKKTEKLRTFAIIFRKWCLFKEGITRKKAFITLKKK